MCNICFYPFPFSSFLLDRLLQYENVDEESSGNGKVRSSNESPRSAQPDSSPFLYTSSYKTRQAEKQLLARKLHVWAGIWTRVSLLLVQHSNHFARNSQP